VTLFSLFAFSCVASALLFAAVSALLARAETAGRGDLVCAGVAFGAAPLIALELASPAVPSVAPHAMLLIAAAAALFVFSGLCSVFIVRRYRLTAMSLAAASLVAALLGVAGVAAALSAKADGVRNLVAFAAAAAAPISFLIHWLVFDGRPLGPFRHVFAGALLAAAATAAAFAAVPEGGVEVLAPEKFAWLSAWAAVMLSLARAPEKKEAGVALPAATFSLEDLPDGVIAFELDANNEVCAATQAAKSFFRLEPSVPQGRKAPLLKPVGAEEGAYCFTDRAGSTHYVRLRERRIESAKHGVRRLVVVELIDEAVAQRESGRRLNARLSSVIDANDDLLLFISESGIVTDINRCALHFLKASRKECVGAYVWTLFPETAKAPSAHGWRDYLAEAEKQETVRVEAALAGGEGQTRLFKLAFFRVAAGEGGAPEFVCFGRDVTEITQTRKSFQEAQSRLEQTIASRTRELQDAKKAADDANLSKSRFLANMSHELRTPLNAILGYTDLMRQDLADEGRKETQEYKDLDRVVVNARNLLNLINDILDLSKVEANKMTLSYSDVALEQFLDDIKSAIDPLVAKRGNVLAVRAADDLHSVTIDRQKVSQCLLNLLSNASKFTEAGKISLNIWTNGADEAPMIYFEVIDTGKGMTPKQCEAIFDEFVQVEDADKLNAGGTGLGLPITRRFCQLMGGDIVAESAPGAGSRFTMWVRDGEPQESKRESAA
jgi:PAS domain S-box-containing protein